MCATDFCGARPRLEVVVNSESERDKTMGDRRARGQRARSQGACSPGASVRSTTELSEPERWSHAQGDHELLGYRWVHPEAPCFLLVHGIGMGHLSYLSFIEAMLPHAEIIAIDLPGFGDSPEPSVALGMGETAELLSNALHSRGISPVIAVGHSMGAQIVAELAARYPTQVTRVVLIAPAVNAQERTLKQQAKRLAQDLFRGKPPRALALGVYEYCKAGPRWFAKKLAPTLEHRIEECLPNVHQPALVLCGSRDLVTPPEWCYEVALTLPDGELTVLGGPGHEAMLAEGQAAAERVLHWLEG